jgi:hypothetical protein
MLLWYDHPRYVKTRDRLVASLTSRKFRFRRSEPIVFLCGGRDSLPRTRLRAYLRKYLGVKVFFAEPVWELIARDRSLGALQMEAELAELANVVIIIAESPGTFAELGAFSLSSALRPKLLPIIDAKYRTHTDSFIATGPLRWIDAESIFQPSVFVAHDRILECAPDIQDRLSRIPSSPSTLSDLTSSKQHLTLFICDLVGIVHPATTAMIHYYCERLLSQPFSGEDCAFLLALGVAMELLQTKKHGGDVFYVPGNGLTASRSFHHLRGTDLPTLRAEHVSAMLNVPAAKVVLNACWGAA